MRTHPRNCLVEVAPMSCKRTPKSPWEKETEEEWDENDDAQEGKETTVERAKKPTLISDAHSRCCLSFEQLISGLQHPVRDFKEHLPVEAVQEEFDKYNIWAGNVGAAHAGKRYEISLDYRLREASFFKEQVSLIKLHIMNLRPSTKQYVTGDQSSRGSG